MLFFVAPYLIEPRLLSQQSLGERSARQEFAA